MHAVIMFLSDPLLQGLAVGFFFGFAAGAAVVIIVDHFEDKST